MAELTDSYGYEAGYFVQGLGASGSLPQTLELAGGHYQVKPQLHCSLVAIKKIVPRLVQSGGIEAAAAEQKIYDALQPLIAKHQPHVEQYLPEIRVASLDDGRRTLLIMVQVAGLAPLFSDLSQALQLDLEVQPAHVTLYTINGLPIDLTNKSELEHHSRALNADEQTEWHAQIDMKKMFGVTR